MTTSQAGTVFAVNRSEQTGTPKASEASIVLDASGVVGDAHSGPWHRQVSLLDVELIEKFSAEHGRKVHPGEFAENITTQGIDLATVAPLDRLESEKVVLEVTQIGKECHGDSCAIFREVGTCIMPKSGIFARVMAGGELSPGDVLVHRPRLLRICTITVSDRASRGEYPDRSGPRVVARLQKFFSDTRWHLDFEAKLVPDTPEAIRAAVMAAETQEADVIITTGGTGIGPRDVTPDVVSDLLDKTIPGIMEHIRIKCVAKAPNALLSRSVAGVMGKTLVYALPGSVKAVDEYLDEILKTLEHAILMAHGLDVH